METKALTEKEIIALTNTCKEMNKYDLEPLFDLLTFDYDIQDLERLFGDLIVQLTEILTREDYYKEDLDIIIYPPAYSASIYLLTRFRETFIKMQENAEKKKFEMQLLVRQKQD